MFSPDIIDFVESEQRGLVRGDTWDIDLSIYEGEGPKDLTGYSALCQVKQEKSSPEVLFQFSTAEGTIPALGNTGEVRLTMPAIESKEFPVGCFFYDLQLTSPTGVVTTFLRGAFEVIEDVSQ